MSEPRLPDVTGRMRSPAATPGHWAGRVRAAEQRTAIPGRPTDRRGDHPRDAPGWTRPVRGPDEGVDRDPVARRAADQRSTRPHRVRSRSEDRVGAHSCRQGREAPDRRDGRLGRGPHRSLDRAPHPAPDRSAVLHPRRPDPRPGVVSDRSTRGSPAARGASRGAAPVRATSAPACACDRDGARRDPTADHPTTARHAHLGITSIYLQGIDTRESASPPTASAPS